MTRLKGMDELNHVFTATVSDSHLVLSVPIASIEYYDDFGAWATENNTKLNEVARVAIENEEVTTKQQADSTQQVAQP